MQTQTPDPNTIVWFDGDFVRLADANVNILTHAFNYGTGVFEGIRGYYQQRELHLMRAVEHFARWKSNCGILRIKVAPSASELAEIAAELCRKNGFRHDVYVRPLAYKSATRLGIATDDEDSFTITALPFGQYFGGRGIKAGVVSWRRVDDNAIPGRAKICGAYVNSVLAGDEARRNGHDEAILLTSDGHVAEGASCNIFLVRDGRLITPPVTDNILEGITRASIIELARKELGIEVIERSVDRSELYICNEVFFTGTAVEVVPVLEVDHRTVGTGQIGSLTEKLRTLYFDATHGFLPVYRRWLHPVHEQVLLGR